MKKLAGLLVTIGGLLSASSPAAYAQGNLVQTIDLRNWTGVPVTIVQPPPPQPAPGFSLTSMAFNPRSNTIYVADYATTNVYAIDAATNTVTSAVYTNGLSSTSDIGAQQNLPGTAPKSVLVNPVTNRWLFMGQGGGAQFSGTTFVEGVNARAFQSGGAWDPATDNVYGADGLEFFAVNNLKFLFAGVGACNASAVNPMTSRVYVSCAGGIVVYDGIVLSNASVKIPTPPLGGAPIPGLQPTGVAVNPNTNRVYVATPTSLYVLDASTYQPVATISGLPDQSTDCLIAGYLCMPLPRPVAINTHTNTIFVINSVSSTISVVDGNTNTLTGTIAIAPPAGAVVSQAAGAQLSEIKPGNTFYDTSTGLETTLGGAISMAVNESMNLLYVASVNGTIGVYALNPSAIPPVFSAAGRIQTAQGAPAAGVAVRAAGPAGNFTAITDASGLFVLAGLPTGTYSVAPSSPSFSFSPASQTVSVIDANVGGLAFQANPPIVPVSFTVSPWTLIGPGVTTTGTVTLNAPAPAGGAVITLSASDAKAAKLPGSITVPAGQLSGSFPVQGNGVSTTTTVALIASYNGGTAAASLTVAPGDKAAITSAVFSQSTQVLTVTATDTNSQATLQVFLASNNQLLGTMVNQGNGSYKLGVVFQGGIPSSVNVVSNLGSKTGQGVTVTP